LVQLFVEENIIVDNLEVNDNGQRFYDFFMRIICQFSMHQKCHAEEKNAELEKTKFNYVQF